MTEELKEIGPKSVTAVWGALGRKTISQTDFRPRITVPERHVCGQNAET